MKRIVMAVILNFVGFGCGSDKKESTATLVAETEETTTTETDETTTTETETETETEPEFNPDAYPIPEGFTKIAVGTFQVEIGTWKIKFKVDFQCSGGVEIRGEFISSAGLLTWMSERFDSQPASWINGYQVDGLTYTASHEEHEETIPKTYNFHNRVLYKCL